MFSHEEAHIFSGISDSTESALFEASLSAVFGVDTYDNSYFTDETKLLQAGVFPHYLGINIKHMEGPVSTV